MTTKEYRDHPSLNYSSLKTLVNGTPAEYKHNLEQPWKGSPAATIGTLVHSIVLEKKLLCKIAAVLPDDAPSKPTKAQRSAKKPSPATLDAIAYHDHWNAENADKEIITEAQWQAVEGAARALDGNEWLNRILEVASVEVPIVGTLDGLSCKGKPDAVWASALSSADMILDIKTVGDSYSVSPNGFAKVIADRHYDLQAALYADLLAQKLGLTITRPAFCWVVVATVAPYSSAIYHCEGDDIYASGKAKMATCFAKIKKANERNEWLGYPVTPQPITFKPWQMFKG